MGMFDSLYAEHGKTGHDDEWQTKAYWCELDEYFVGDEMPPVKPYELDDYQVEVLGTLPGEEFARRFATVTGGLLREVGVVRDGSLPLLNYSGHLIESREAGA